MNIQRPQRAASRPLLVVTIGLSAALLSGSASGEAETNGGAPPQMVAFFGSETAACPEGFTRADYATGRLVVSVIKEASVGRQIGAPLADQEDRTHEHSYSASIDLPYKAVAAADGANNQGAKAQTYAVTEVTEPAATDLPFIQLLACEKQ